MEQGKLDDAIATLNGYLASKPNSTEGYTLLQPALLAAGRLYLKRLDRPEDALRNYKADLPGSPPRLGCIQAGVKDAQQALARISAGTTITKS